MTTTNDNTGATAAELRAEFIRLKMQARQEWLHSNGAPMNWAIVTVEEARAAANEYRAIFRQRDELAERLTESEAGRVQAEKGFQDWYQAGLSIATILVTFGSKSDGIVDGVRELLADRDALRTKLETAEKALEHCVSWIE